MKSILRLFFCLTPLLLCLCNLSAADETEASAVRARASQFISFLQAKDWEKAAEMVLPNDAAFRRFNINKNSPDASQKLQQNIRECFRLMYGTVKPGAIASIHINPDDPKSALVSYHHDDLDAFRMRFENSDWYYSFD